MHIFQIYYIITIGDKFMDNIKLFQQKMQTLGIDLFLIPTADYHNSEYISSYFKIREFLTGFTGSAGTLVMTQTDAYLWVDGRYFIQAAKQIEGKPITLMKMGTPNTPTVLEFIKSYIKENMTIAFDGKMVDSKTALKIKELVPEKTKIIINDNITDTMWADRPSLPFSLLYKLDDFYSGKTYKEKLDIILKKMEEEKIDTYIISALEDQAWLYNLRGNDVTHTPVFLAYTVITPAVTTLFIDQRKIDITINKYLDENDIAVRNYNDIFEYIKSIRNKKVLINPSKVSYAIYNTISNNASNTIILNSDYTSLLKAVKNDTEIKNTRIAHAKDGVAVFRLMNHLKSSYEKKQDLSELGLSDTIEKYRREQEGFIDLSFDTICAFNEHGAMMHYKATTDSSSKITGSGLVLIDSGGHYFEGTTDITRTYSVGRISDKIKVHYTTVLKSVINLSKATFLKGCTGQNLDILARGPIWDLLLDYKCGTGHGVGNLLSVHEGPNGFRWQKVPEREDSAVLEPGMITTNEPGIYLENSYGIRIENEMLCVKKETNDFGTFYGFETITYAPIDLDPIKTTMLTKEEKDWINEYHQMVFERLSPYLEKDEIQALAKYTRKI